MRPAWVKTELRSGSHRDYDADPGPLLIDGIMDDLRIKHQLGLRYSTSSRNGGRVVGEKVPRRKMP